MVMKNTHTQQTTGVCCWGFTETNHLSMRLFIPLGHTALSVCASNEGVFIDIQFTCFATSGVLRYSTHPEQNIIQSEYVQLVSIVYMEENLILL